MSSSIARSSLVSLIAGLLAIASAVFLGMYGTDMNLPVLATIVVCFIALGISFVRGTEGLYLVIFAMLFSPEISSGLSTGKITGEGSGAVVLRLEDIIMFSVVIGWMLRSAFTGRHMGIIKTKVNGAIWMYMAASIVATLFGVLGGSVKYFSAGLFNNIKYFEYFLLFFMILAHVRQREIVVKMIWALFAVFFLAMVYGYTQLGSGRVSAPFDAEPNTFGGYIVLLMCLAGGIALTDKRAKIRMVMIFLILFGGFPLLFTLSRASYLAMIVAILSFMVVSTHRVLILSIALALISAMLLGLPLMPEQVRERVAGTFERETEYHEQIAGVDFDASSSARIVSYKQAVNRWVKSPVFGYGVTGTHFIDGQYPRLLVETGVIGLATFLLIFWRLIGEVMKVYIQASDPFLKGVAMGFFCGIFAMLAHGIAANSFIIIRIAEPFWMIAGLVLIIPMIERKINDSAVC